MNRPAFPAKRNPPSATKFASLVSPGGLLIANASLISGRSGRTDLRELAVPCTALAREAGDDRLVSVAALGALIGAADLLDPAFVVAALRQIVGQKQPESLASDLAIFERGRAFGSNPGPNALPSVNTRDQGAVV